VTTLAILLRGDAGYEDARRASVANGRCPDRFPAAIVRARDEQDVVGAVRLATEQGWRVSVRSGGHSWTGSHLRDGGLLIDVGALRDMVVDAEARTAEVQPGLRSSVLAARLSEAGLFFPTGHCIGPCVGGFLLQGGFGWSSRAVGPACMSVAAIDVVTADGALVRADEHEHPELFWAARGAGPGFFGVVTRFHLRLQERPPAQLRSVQLYGPEHLGELMRWVHAVGPEVSPEVELMVFMRRDLMGHRGPGLQLFAPALAASEAAARDALAFVAACPLRSHALEEELNVPTDVRELVAHSAELDAEARRTRCG
jgi:FAD/FMN-containing dehydrogenase